MITLEEKLEGVTVLETAPLLFTGIVDENIEQNFTLYLLQESEGKFTIFAPTFYNADIVRGGSNDYPLNCDFSVTFGTLEEAKERFDAIVEHLGNPLDLHDIEGGFMLVNFDMDDDIYEQKPSLLPKYDSRLVRYSLDETIFFRIINVENRVIINKRMCLEYETKEAALKTYMAIVKYFKEIDVMVLRVGAETSEVITDENETVQGLINRILATNFDNARALEITRNEEGEYIQFQAVIFKGDLRISVNYLNDVNSFLGHRIHCSVRVSEREGDENIFYKPQIRSVRTFIESVNEVLPYII